MKKIPQKVLDIYLEKHKLSDLSEEEEYKSKGLFTRLKKGKKVCYSLPTSSGIEQFLQALEKDLLFHKSPSKT